MTSHMSRLSSAAISLLLTIPLSVIVTAIFVGESCGFYPGMLTTAVFGLLLFTTPYGAGAALAMTAIGAAGRRRGVYANAAIVLVALASFVVLAIAWKIGYVPWPSRCTIDF